MRLSPQALREQNYLTNMIRAPLLAPERCRRALIGECLLIAWWNAPRLREPHKDEGSLDLASERYY